MDTDGGRGQALSRLGHAMRRPRVVTARGVPATRDLERTLWCLLAASGVAIGARVLARTPVEAAVSFGAAVLLLAFAAATLRAIATLTPPTLRARRATRVAVVGGSASADRLRDDLREAGVAGIDVVGAVAPEGAATDGFALGVVADLGAVVDVHRLDVLLVGPGVTGARVVEAVMRTCEGDAVRVCALSGFYEDVFGHVPITEVDDAWLQYVLHPRFRERRSQRIVDVVVAGALAVVFLPVIACMALLIRRDGGPAFFRQQRIGRDGRRFVIYKLRSMRWEPDGAPARWAEDGDTRITRLGRLLRRMHLDELPQLINVLRGDMTLVGPRPEQPEIVESLAEGLPLWRGRHRYKPGVTGWAQVRCGYGGSHDGSALKLANDLYYLRHQSLALDMAILAQTAITALSPPRRDEDVVVPFVLPPAREPARQRLRPARFVPAWRSGATRALVTGGAGFIGSQLVDRLVDEGYDVVALDDLSAGRAGNLAEAFTAGARLETADITDADEMRRLFIAHRPEVVFHLAAQIAVSRAVEEPLMDATANVVGTLSALEAARACGARRFVLASSGGAIYGDALVKPTPEHAPLIPLSPYGTAKLAAEQYTALYNDLYGLSTATLRLANVYGPRQGLNGEGGVIARFCRALVDGERAQVFGDGLQTRDYVHVRDVVAAFFAAGQSQASGAFNIGTGTETTLLDLLEALDLEATFHEARNGEVRRSSLDASAAARELDWHASMPLVDGLAETLAFAREAWATQVAV